MEYVALGIAVVALLAALVGRAKAAGLTTLAQDSQRDARRMSENLAEGVEKELGVMRRQLAEVAAGDAPTREMILDGRLWRDVSSPEGRAMLEAGGLHVLDVRAPQETAAGVIPGAQLIPVDQLQERMRELPKDGKPTLIYCAGGGRSAAACEFLSGEGFDGLYNLSGGFGSWGGSVEKQDS